MTCFQNVSAFFHISHFFSRESGYFAIARKKCLISDETSIPALFLSVLDDAFQWPTQ
jgi:hypothetical protein